MQKQYKIAVIDDEQEILALVERYLHRSGKYNVATFSNPVTALSKIDSTYDVVFCDIMMPQMNGLEALEKMIEKNPHQKVIMMTAFSTLDTLLTSHRHGAQQYIIKPFSSLAILDEMINSVLNGESMTV